MGVEATTPVFKVRPARMGDREVIASLLNELGYADCCDGQTLIWVVRHPEIEVFVATDGADRPIGLVTLSHRPQLRLSGRIATVDELVVAGAWRGRGVGRALLARAVDRAKVLGCKRIELRTNRARESYRRSFYTKNGFREVDSAVLRLADLEKKR